MTAVASASPRPVPRTTQAWVHRGCALLVAGVAAYSSYAHQRQFALDGGADPVAAALWPLSVDGLVVLASTGLLARHAGTTRRAWWAMRLAFLLGVAVSLAANIAAAPALTWQPIVVAGWPPLALLLAIDLVLHSRRRDRDRPSLELVIGEGLKEFGLDLRAYCCGGYLGEELEQQLHDRLHVWPPQCVHYFRPNVAFLARKEKGRLD